MRFATQLLLWQLACVIAVVAVCTAVFTWLGVQQLRAEAESSALSIARTVANDPDVRSSVQRYSNEDRAPRADELLGGPLASLAADVEQTKDRGNDDERNHRRQPLGHDEHHECEDHGESEYDEHVDSFVWAVRTRGLPDFAFRRT